MYISKDNNTSYSFPEHLKLLEGLNLNDSKDFHTNINKSIKESEKEISYLLHFGDIEKNENGMYELPVVESYQGYEELPEGYGLKGGAARLLLEMNLGLPTRGEPRDIDLIRYKNIENSTELDHELAKKYMPDDYRYGDGVEKVTENYFETRDFSINEVMVKGNKIICSPQCLKDTISHIVRPTTYTYNEDFENHEYSTFIKSLRFYVDYYERFGKAKLKLINQEQLHEYYNNAFWIALNLDRAHGISDSYSYKLLKILKEIQQIPNEIFSVKEAKKYIVESEAIYGDFSFQNIPDSIEIPEENNNKELKYQYPELENLHLREGKGKKYKK